MFPLHAFVPIHLLCANKVAVDLWRSMTAVRYNINAIFLESSKKGRIEL